MKATLIVGTALVAWSAVAQALSPYVDADKAAGGTLEAAQIFAHLHHLHHHL